MEENASRNRKESRVHNLQNMEPYFKNRGLQADAEFIEQLENELGTATERIATLESELTNGQKTISHLLADDLRNSEENAQLKEMIWTFHQGPSGDCECNVCAEVEQSRTELGGLHF